MPFRLSQLLRTICGRGYSASGLLVSTRLAQGVIKGACFICQGPAWLLTAKAVAQSQAAFSPVNKVRFVAGLLNW